MTNRSILQDEARKATELLRGKVISEVFRRRSGEVAIEFTDGTRLFVDRGSGGVELSLTGSGTQPNYTRLQGRYLTFIQEYLRLHRVAPSEGDLQAYFQVTPPTVHQMILTLERKGLIDRVPGKARSIRVLVEPKSFMAGGSVSGS